MIEVTQKNRHGNVQIIETYETEAEFGLAYRYHFGPDFIRMFSTKHLMLGGRDEYSCKYAQSHFVPEYPKVAYTEKGKIIDPSHLLGIIRQYYRLFRQYWRHPGTKSQKRHVTGSYFRKIHTTPERRWAHAWDDEEFAPKCRARRNSKNLPESWDDYYRTGTKNWKKYRSHQWKE